MRLILGGGLYSGFYGIKLRGWITSHLPLMQFESKDQTSPIYTAKALNDEFNGQEIFAPISQPGGYIF